MKTVQLNDAGYTADGKWRLVLVEPTPEMVDGANKAIVAGGFFTRKSDFVKGAILASPKPDLPDVDIDAMRREMAELRAQVPDEWRSVMQDSAAIFRHYEALHKAKGGIADDKAERNRLAAERIEALLQPQPAEPVIDKPTLPPSWQVVRVPDVEFQPRDQIYISKIGVDGKAERGGTACRLDDSSLFWHFFNDWLLATEDKRPADLTPLPIYSEGGHCD